MKKIIRLTPKIERMKPETREELQKIAFDSYDNEGFDDDEYDADAYESPQRVSVKTRRESRASVSLSTFTINVDNQTGATARVELLNAANSISEMANDIITNLNPFTAAARDAVNLNSLAWWDTTGKLNLQKSDGTLVIISCSEVPYKQLLFQIRSGSYKVFCPQIKMTFVNDPQLDQPITVGTKVLFGSVKSNTFKPRDYFKPDQYQSKFLTMPANLAITDETRLFYDAVSAEKNSFTFFCQKAKM